MTVTKPTYSQHKVRTSLKDRTLDSMFSTSNPSQIGHGSRSELGKTREDAIDADGGVPPDPGGNLEAVRAKEVKESKCYLTSVKSLRDGVQKAKHQSKPRPPLLSAFSADFANLLRRSHGNLLPAYLCRHRRSRQVSFTHSALYETLPSEPLHNSVRLGELFLSWPNDSSPGKNSFTSSDFANLGTWHGSNCNHRLLSRLYSRSRLTRKKYQMNLDKARNL